MERASASPAAASSPPREWVARLAPPVAAVVVALGCTLLLLGLAPWELQHQRVVGAFHDGHVWAFEHIARMLVGAESLGGETTRIGFPGPVLARFIGWVPAFLAAPLQPLLGPLGAYNLVLVSSPALAVVSCWALLRRVTRVSGGAAAGLSLAYALCPYALGCLQSGQVAKLQHWLIPAIFLAVSHAFRGERRWAGLLVSALLTLALAFSSPSTALFLPLGAGFWVLAELLEARGRGLAWGRALGLSCAALAAVGLALLPARLYFGDLRRAGVMLAFEPRVQRLLEGSLPYPPPVAQPEGLLLGLGGLAQQAQDASHVVYLGLPLLLVALGLGLRARPGRLAGWSLLVLGVVLSLGPLLVSGDGFVLWGTSRLRLPVLLLEALGYPSRDSGMYYRAVVLASLGLVVLCAAGWPRRPTPLWIALAWVLGCGQIADGVRATRSLWPTPHAAMPGVATLEAMAADSQPGAVMDLPLEHGTLEGGVAMLAATVHRRPTTALPRQTSRQYLPLTQRIGAWFDTAAAVSEPELARASLASRGFRYLVWRPWLDAPERLPALEASFGPAQGDPDLYYWVLDAPE